MRFRPRPAENDDLELVGLVRGVCHDRGDEKRLPMLRGTEYGRERVAGREKHRFW